MKTRSILATCIAVFSYGCTSLPATAQNRFDISLEGPWILYQDTSFTTVPVLIVMAPGVGDNSGTNPIAFHIPQVNAGDGYFIDTVGIYCLTFGTTCAPKVGSGLSVDGYPPIATLPVKLSAGSAWDWVTTSRTYGTVTLILPMPDTYSNDGVWPMHFGQTFSSTQQGYKDVSGPQHSIGVHLHYNKGPASFDLFGCPDKSTPTVGNCIIPPKFKPTTHIANDGTLRIQMKGPEIDDTCDPHVRKVYPEMIKLIDKTNNADIAVIDPARVDDNLNPTYDDSKTNCLGTDPQGGGHGSAAESQHTTMSGPVPKVSLQLAQIVDTLSTPLFTEEQKNTILSGPIKSATTNLDPNFPRISLLLKIERLVRRSEDGVDSLLAQLTSQQARVQSDSAPRGQEASIVAVQIQLLNTLKTKEDIFLATTYTKGGNDCRAPLMQVGQ